MRYPVFRLSQGRTALSNLRNPDGSRGEVVPELRGSQSPTSGLLAGTVLEHLSRSLSVTEADALLASGLTRDGVEGALSLRLHDELRDVTPTALCDPDFWRFVAVAHVRPFVYWRDGANCSMASFGLNAVRRIPDCVPLRMYNRAHIARAIETDGGGPALNVATSGGADFWQSHVLRVQNRFDHRIVRHLVDGLADGAIKNVEALREIAKDIRQLRSNRVLELTSDRSLRPTIRGLIANDRGDDA